MGETVIIPATITEEGLAVLDELNRIKWKGLQ